MRTSKLFSFLLFALTTTALTTLFAEGVDEQEPNNILAGAQTISIGVFNGEVVDGVNEDDWFRLNIATPGLLYLSMEHPLPVNLGDGTNDLSMRLKNSIGQYLAANLITNAKEEFSYHVIIPGDYWILISQTVPAANGGNTYTLTSSRVTTPGGDDANDTGGGDDTFDTATTISDYNQPTPTLTALDEDWFSFLAPAGTFTVELEYDGSTRVGIEAYNSSGGRLINSPTDLEIQGGQGPGTAGNESPASIEIDILDADTIYLAVYGGTGASYTITIDHPVVWSKTLSSGPNSASSPTIFDIDGDGKGEILIGSRPHIDGANAELKPAQLIVLEHDGTVKWTQSFPAASLVGLDPDPVTGKFYTTSSISTRPAVGDIDGDGSLEIVVGVGVDLDYTINGGEIYSPGHKGAMYALDALTGAVEWVRISGDTFGSNTSGPDGLPDGIISSPLICDLDQDGFSEVIWGGWDQKVYAVDGRTGLDFGVIFGGQWPASVHDTNWSTALCADINDDGLHEVLIGGDITENPDALTLSGGLFHVYDRFGRDIIDGFGTPIEFVPGSGNFSFFKGKYEEQTIWSSPIAGDLDGDGSLEIAYGTGLFFDAPIGEYIRIWNHDGTEYDKLSTMGRTFAPPLFADLDQDGDLEIVAVTDKGWVHAWNGSNGLGAAGTALFSTQTFPSGGTGADHPIYSAPLAVDMNGNGRLEIIFQQGLSPVILDSFTGLQLTDPTKSGLNNESFRGTPAIGDLDGDGNLEIVTGGTNAAGDTGVIYAFKFGTPGNATANAGSYDYARRQFRESGVIPISSAQIARRAQVNSFVTRFYTEVLDRAPDIASADWVNRLLEGDRSGGDVGRGFVLSTEFVNKAKNDSDFLDIVYRAFFNRVADTPGKDGWLTQIAGGATRADVLNGFVGAQEFLNLSTSFNITAEFTPTQGLRRKLIEEFVTRFYNQILLRSPDGPGLAAWTDGTMTGTQTGGSLANGFINSNEFVARGLSNIEYVKVLYRAFFGRSSTEIERAGWVNGLDSETLQRQQVLEGFIGAQEFINLANIFGISPS